MPLVTAELDGINLTQVVGIYMATYIDPNRTIIPVHKRAIYPVAVTKHYRVGIQDDSSRKKQCKYFVSIQNTTSSYPDTLFHPGRSQSNLI